MPGQTGTVEHGFKRQSGLPIRSATKDESVVLAKTQFRAYGSNLVRRDAIRRQFVGVEDAFDARKFGSTCQFSPQSRELGAVLIGQFLPQPTKQTFEWEGHHDRATSETISDHAR